MAMAGTLFRIQAEVADIDRQHYHAYDLRMVRHPSETDERLMVRLLAFLHQAHPELTLTRGLSEIREPDIWHRDAMTQILEWIEVGQPDAARLQFACKQSGQVRIYTFGAHPERWWARVGDKLDRWDNLSVWAFPLSLTRKLAERVARQMRVQCTIQEEMMTLVLEDEVFEVDFSKPLIQAANI